MSSTPSPGSSQAAPARPAHRSTWAPSPSRADVRNAALQIGKVIPSLQGASQNLAAFEATLGQDYPAEDSSTDETEGQDIANLLNNLELSFPLLQNPSLAANALLGGVVDLFTLKEPDTFIGVGKFDANGAVLSTQTILAVPIEVPPIPIAVTPALGAALGATVGLDLGFDTTGLQAYAANGFRDPSQIADGLYISNPGPNDPIIRLEAALQLGVTVDAPFTSVKVDGGIDGNVDVSLKNPGKTYLSSLLPTIESDPLSVFDIAGRLGGNVGVTVSVGPASFSLRTPDFTLFSFGDQTSSGPPRQTATWNYPGLLGYLEVPSNWTFAHDPAVPGFADFYGDTTIQANTSVTYRGDAPVDMSSLTLGQGGTFELDHNTIRIDGRASNVYNAGTAYGSENDGTLIVTGDANLVVDADLYNTGKIELGLAGNPLATTDLPSISVNELLSLAGGGTVVTYGAATWTVANTSDSAADGLAELWNIDNTVEGSGTFLHPGAQPGHVRCGRRRRDGLRRPAGQQTACSKRRPTDRGSCRTPARSSSRGAA